jgi:hypothetical protein
MSCFSNPHTSHLKLTFFGDISACAKRTNNVTPTIITTIENTFPPGVVIVKSP